MSIKMKLNVTPLNEADMNKKYADRKRVGKTRRDHESGSWKQRFDNQAARATWSNDPRRTATSHPNHRG